MSVTRAAIKTRDNETVVNWSRIASAEEQRAVTVAEILNRLIESHIRTSGNVPPRREIEGSSE